MKIEVDMITFLMKFFVFEKNNNEFKFLIPFFFFFFWVNKIQSLKNEMLRIKKGIEVEIDKLKGIK